MPSRRAQYLLIASTLGFSLMGACYKAVAPTIPVLQAICLRSLVCVLVIAFVMAQRGESFRGNNYGLLLWRSVGGICAICCSFLSVRDLALGDATLLLQTFPLFAVLLAILTLRERPAPLLYLWIVVAWAGILLVLRPQLAIMNVGGVVALLGGFFIGANTVAIRRSTVHDTPLRVAFYFSAATVVVTAPVMFLHYVPPSPREWLLLLATGLFAAMAQTMMTLAYSLDHVSRLSPLSYLSIVYAYALGLIFWDELPSVWSLAGAVLIVASCLGIMWRRRPMAEFTQG